MNPIDKYNIGVTFHESTVTAMVAALVPKFNYPYRAVRLPSGVLSQPHVRHYGEAPENYLGKSVDNSWPPVAVLWKSDRHTVWDEAQGSPSRGLYWAPNFLGIPSIGPHSSDEYIGELVPIEHLLWVLEPDRLRSVVGASLHRGSRPSEAQLAAHQVPPRLISFSSADSTHVL